MVQTSENTSIAQRISTRPNTQDGASGSQSQLSQSLLELRGFMKEATRDDAVLIASILNVNKEAVWEIIKGMRYSAHSELAMAVHKAFSL